MIKNQFGTLRKSMAKWGLIMIYPMTLVKLNNKTDRSDLLKSVVQGTK